MTRIVAPRVLLTVFAAFLLAGPAARAGFGGVPGTRTRDDRRRDDDSAVDVLVEDEREATSREELEDVVRRRRGGFGGALKSTEEALSEAGLTLEELEREKAAQAKMRVTRVAIPRDLLLLYDWSLRFTKAIRPQAVWVKRDLILLQTRPDANELYAIDRMNGNILWKVILTKQITYPPEVTKEAVYVVVDNYIIAIDKVQGRVIWRRQPDFPISAQPMVIEPTIYVPSWEGKFYALDSTRKEKIYVKGKTEETTYRAFEYDLRYRWHLTTKGSIIAPGVEKDQMLYFGSEDGFMYCMSRDGELRYQFQTQGKVQASPAAIRPTVFVGATDYNLYAVDRLTGEQQWHFPAGGDILSPPTADPTSQLVYVPVRGQGYYALHTFDGRIMWHMKEGKIIAGLSADRIYMLMAGRRLAAMEKKTGRVTWLSLLAGFAFGIESTNDWTDEADPMRVYLVDAANVLVSLREQERLYRSKKQEAASAPAGEEAAPADEAAPVAEEEEEAAW